ncbi:hypothetical protein [Clostridium saccharobutylicum]|nr:hypothetical protein [Clostridium saccharobutylicum]MBA2903483.1 hypothetical protein [Clostridium saccharobutylicum]MBA8788318.1 hypothetical protein [Clostridium saccharobutylicum]MBA8894997.1 hypothetical protein [Clostridium saccharobutylicum]MBA8992288.1 hypothetical protein [Clostridium saccharobutylicum]NSB46327.1 hypothetical protein [Clostridium saccharobutylicum]
MNRSTSADINPHPNYIATEKKNATSFGKLLPKSKSYLKLGYLLI